MKRTVYRVLFCSSVLNALGHFGTSHDEDDEQADGAAHSQAYNALWMASIWWEAGYQQGRKENTTPNCNDIRKIIENNPDYTAELLPNCHSNGNWLPLQCNSESCWCTFIDSGLAIQTLPHIARNESIICPKKYLLGKDPCAVNATPCNGRAYSYKWIYDDVTKMCTRTRTCAGFDQRENCMSTCAPEPLSLCTLPLNEGNCTPQSNKSNRPSSSGSLSGLLGTVTETKYYFNSKTSTCDEFKQGRCGGNSNSFETKMKCAATCLKDTMMAVKVKIGGANLDMNLPAWLALRLNLSSEVAKEVPENQLETVLKYSRFLKSKDSNKATLVDDIDLTQRSGVLTMNQNSPRPSLLYPRCIKNPYKGPCKALEYKWAWSSEVNGCVVYPFGGCIAPGVDIDDENTFENKVDCVLKCAPIKNPLDSTEVAGFLGAGDPESKPEELLRTPGMALPPANTPSEPPKFQMPSPMLSIPSQDMAKMTQGLNLPNMGFQFPPGFG